MTNARPVRFRSVWVAIGIACAGVLLWASLSHRVYHLTVPGDETWPRKVLSVVAFALVAYVADRALPPSRHRVLRAVAIGAAFSALIEVEQKLHHSHEGLLSNAFDIACGALGGWLAALARTIV